MTGYNFACKNVGMNCAFEIRGASSKAEALEQAAAHAKHAHQITTIPPELAAKVNAAVRS
jgi:predicted small metal-binding protein